MMAPGNTSRRGLNILIVSSFFPWHGHGGGTRLKKTIQALSKKNTITLLTPIRDEERPLIREMEKYCREIIIFSIDDVKTDNTDVLQIYNDPPEGGGILGPIKALGRHYVIRFHPDLWQQYLIFRRENAIRVPHHLRRYYSQDFIEKFNRLIKEKNFDVIDLHFTEMALYADLLPDDCVKVYTTHEARTVTYFRHALHRDGWFKKFAFFVQWSKMKAFERESARKFDVVVAFSPRDQKFFRKCTNSDIRVPLVPTGVDISALSYGPIEGRDRATAMFLGYYRNYPNHDAAIYFLDKIYPRVKSRVPDFRVVFIGSFPPQELVQRADGENIVVTGYVDDFHRYLHKGTVFIVPIRLGGGIKGKIIEAMALGIPVISTPQGAEGIKATPGKNIVLARSAKAFSGKLVQILGDRSLQERLSRNGRKLVEELYDWNKNAADLESCIVEAHRKRTSKQVN